MTKHESFKRRIRERMAKTGERYGAARRVLLERTSSSGGRRRAAEPEMSDDAVLAATGRGWDEWCDLLDARPDGIEGHTAIAAYLVDDVGVDGWWAQTVTVGYERITGLRLPNQRADGTFATSRSRTVLLDGELLRELLLDEEGRDDLFPGLETELRSRAASKVLRIGMEAGVAQISLNPRDDGRLTVTVQHERLESPDDVEVWKAFWGDWLDALDGA